MLKTAIFLSDIAKKPCAPWLQIITKFSGHHMRLKSINISQINLKAEWFSEFLLQDGIFGYISSKSLG